MNEKSSQEIATVDVQQAKYGKRNKITATKRITYIATLVAASLVLKIASALIKTETVTLSFVYIPWIIAAIVLGPVGGFAVAAISDLLGAAIQGYLPPNPILTLGCAMYGFIMGLVFKIPKIDPRLQIVIGMLIVIPVCTLGLNSLGIFMYYAPQKTFTVFMTYVTARLLQIPVVVLNVAITTFFFPLLKKKGFLK